MAHLRIYRGLPASGKSTDAVRWVKEDLENRVRINRDTLRLMMHGGEFVKGVTEQEIIRARNSLVKTFLKAGKQVAVDDTNLPKRTVTELIKMANKMNATWEIVDLTDVDVEECVRRDYGRENAVGEGCIRDMHTRFLKGKAPLDFSALDHEIVKMEKYVPNRQLPGTAYISDIDGTVAKMTGRSPYDYTQVSLDRPNYPVIDVLRELSLLGHRIVFTSGRPESCRQDTEDWLRTFVGVPFVLIMRATGDARPDWIVKYELFDKHIRDEYNVLGVFDDRDQVVSMWREIGLTCFQVDFGDF